MNIDFDHIDSFLQRLDLSSGAITVLTGAGISAESNIPTFRGPEGYWTVGSKVYQPQEMATYEMFAKNPRAVWQWYLYRLGVCQTAQPNPGHQALVSLEQHLADRFTLITQNVDNLHLRAGQNPRRTFQIHGNIFYARCAKACRSAVELLPTGISGKTKTANITAAEWQLLHCTKCNNLLRPHVLWFDESYNERYYHSQSALYVAQKTALLIVVGTSGSTNLPAHIVSSVYQSGGLIIDINIEANPFSHLAQGYDRGMVLRYPSSAILPSLVARIKSMVPTG